MPKQDESEVKVDIESKELPQGAKFPEKKHQVVDDPGVLIEEDPRDLQDILFFPEDINLAYPDFYDIEVFDNLETNKNKAVDYGLLNILDFDSMVHSKAFTESELLNIVTNYANNADKSHGVIIKIGPENNHFIEKFGVLKNSVSVVSTNDEVLKKAKEFTPLKQNVGVNVFSEDWSLNAPLLKHFKINRCNTCGFTQIMRPESTLKASTMEASTIKKCMFLVSPRSLMLSSQAKKRKRELFYKVAEKLKLEQISSNTKDLQDLEVGVATQTSEKINKSLEVGSLPGTEQNKFDSPDNQYMHGSTASTVVKFLSTLAFFFIHDSWVHHVPDAIARATRYGFQYKSSTGKVNKLDIVESGRVMGKLTDTYCDLMDENLDSSNAMFFATLDIAANDQANEIEFKRRKDKAVATTRTSNIVGSAPVALIAAAIASGLAIKYGLTNNENNTAAEYNYFKAVEDNLTTALSSAAKFLNFGTSLYAYVSDTRNRSQLNKLSSSNKQKQNFNKEGALLQYVKYKTKTEFLNRIEGYKFDILPSSPEKDSKKKQDIIIFDYRILFNQKSNSPELLLNNFRALQKIDPAFDKVIVIPDDLPVAESDYIFQQLWYAKNTNDFKDIQLLKSGKSVVNAEDDQNNVSIAVDTDFQSYNRKVYVGEDSNSINTMRCLDSIYDNVAVVEIPNPTDDDKVLTYPHLVSTGLLEVIPFFEKKNNAHVKSGFLPLSDETFKTSTIAPQRLPELVTPPLTLDIFSKRPEYFNVLHLDSLIDSGPNDVNIGQNVLHRIYEQIQHQNTNLRGGSIDSPSSLTDPLNRFLIIGDENVIKDLEKNIIELDAERNEDCHRSIRFLSKNEYSKDSGVSQIYENIIFDQMRVISDNPSDLRKVYNDSDMSSNICTIGVYNNENCMAFANDLDNLFANISDSKSKLFEQRFLEGSNLKDMSAFKTETLKSAQQVSDLVFRFGSGVINLFAYGDYGQWAKYVNPVINSWNTLGAEVGTALNVEGRNKISTENKEKGFLLILEKISFELAEKGYTKKDIVGILELSRDKIKDKVNRFTEFAEKMVSETESNIGANTFGVLSVGLFLGQIMIDTMKMPQIKDNVFRSYDLPDGYQSLDQSSLFNRPPGDTSNSTYGSDVENEFSEVSRNWQLASDLFGSSAFLSLMTSQILAGRFNRLNDKKMAQINDDIKNFMDGEAPFNEFLDAQIENYEVTQAEPISIIPLPDDEIGKPQSKENLSLSANQEYSEITFPQNMAEELGEIQRKSDQAASALNSYNPPSSDTDSNIAQGGDITETNTSPQQKEKKPASKDGFPLDSLTRPTLERTTKKGSVKKSKSSGVKKGEQKKTITSRK